MRFSNLEAWLAWQETLHPVAIDLGLDRVRNVLSRLSLTNPGFSILTVGGTNGKGTCVAYAEAVLLAAGHVTGAYFSPHLLRYNERVRINGVEATDAAFCDAFERVDRARQDISLTYFEFGTLAALVLFQQAGVEIALLEVGMGGRLDAVNALDAEVSLVTSIGLDHQEWLGEGREAIGYEKACIYRSGCPAICGDRQPPRSLLAHADRLGAHLQRLGVDYDWEYCETGWRWYSANHSIETLPLPVTAQPVQLDNAAATITALRALPHNIGISMDALRTGIATASLPGRLQRIPGPVECLLDVAHNPDAARVLAEVLANSTVPGSNFAVMGMLADKAVEEMVTVLVSHFQRWYLATLDGPRGLSCEALARRVSPLLPGGPPICAGGMIEAYKMAMADARPGDRVVVFGSFYAVGPVLAALKG